MAFHCGATTRDGSACQRHVREPGTRCPQHRNLGGTALHPPRYAMRTVSLTNPALTAARTAWSTNARSTDAWSTNILGTARSGLTNRAAELRDRVTWSPEEESDAAEPGTVADEEAVTTENETRDGAGSPANGWAAGEAGAGAGEAGAGEAGAGAGEAGAGAGEAGAAGDGSAALMPVGRLSYLDQERAERTRRIQEAADGEQKTEAKVSSDAENVTQAEAEPAGGPEREVDSVYEGAELEGAEPEGETTKTVIRLSYLDRERAGRARAADPDDDMAGLAYLDREHAEREQPTEPETESGPAQVIIRLSYLDRERAGRTKVTEPESIEPKAENQPENEAEPTPESAADFEAEPEFEAESGAEFGAEAEYEAEAELARRAQPQAAAEAGFEHEKAEIEIKDLAEPQDLAEPEPEAAAAFEPEIGDAAEIDAEALAEPEPESVAAFERAAELEPVDLAESQDPADPGPEPEPEAEPEAEVAAVVEPEARPVEQRPLLRKERPLDPDWIGGRPLFRDEAPTRPLPRIEFEPSEPSEPAEPAEPSEDSGAPRKQPRIAPMRSVVLNPRADEVSQAPAKPAPAPDADPPTLIDRMPPIDPDDLVVPDFLRPDFVVDKPKVRPQQKPPAARVPKPQPRPTPAPAPAPAQTPAPALAKPSAAAPAPTPAPAPDPPTLIAPPLPAEELSVPDFIIPGFSQPAAEPPLRTVLSTVLGPDLWQRCYAEWGPPHCIALARIARAVDGLAPSATAAMRSTAGAGMRWLGVAREREALADAVADAITHPAGASSANQARTLRLYGAAICVALNLPLRRCACHSDLERDVSGDLIRLGLAELAGEVR